MNMKNFKNIFKFTTSQLLKGKAFKISTVIILILVFVGTGLVTVLSDGIKNNDDKTIVQDQNIDDGQSASDEQNGDNISIGEIISIKKLYVKNESGLNINIKEALGQLYPGMAIEDYSKDDKEIQQKLMDTEEPEAYLLISNENNVINVNMTTPKNEDAVSSGDAENITHYIVSMCESKRLVDAGVKPEDTAKLMLPVQSSVQAAGDERSLVDMLVQTILPMVLCITFFYIIYFYGYWVANSIVSEKTSRVMELLLTSVKPLELVVGKCVGMGVLAIGQFAMIIGTAFAANKIGIAIVKGSINEKANPFDIMSILGGITPMNLVFIILFFIFGYMLYSVFNALVGATISRLEDLNTAMMPVTLVGIIGFYIAYGAIMAGGVSTIEKVALYVPFASPFYVPSKLAAGSIEPLQLAISLGILIISAALFIVFTSRVYSVVILHTGNRLKAKDLIQIFKSEK